MPSPEKRGTNVGWALAACFVPLVAVLYHLYAEAAAENEELRRRLEKAKAQDDSSSPRAENAMKLASSLESYWPVQAVAVLEEELLRGASSCAPTFDPSCILQHGHYRPRTKIELLDALGDAHGAATHYEKAALFHERALQQKHEAGFPPSEIVTSYSAVATDATNLFHFEEALSWIRQGQGLALPKAALAILYQQESGILECQDDFISALHVFEHSLKLQEKSVADALRHLDLLKQVLHEEMPPSVASAMRGRVAEIEEELIRLGYGKKGQFPKRYVPGLGVGRPWRSFPTETVSASWMLPASQALRAAVPELLLEYLELKEAGQMYREKECIHSHRGGRWSRFEVNAFWHASDSGGIRCAVESPRACALFQELQALGMPLIRAGYSALAPGAWLKPHYGTTNAQLKWHLGLSIPSSPTEGCATLRVADVIHQWMKEGELLYFDDSFEHEVFNHCDMERVVFQLVFAHPQLGGSDDENLRCATGDLQACRPGLSTEL
ncbi:unnamed protein product [Durusdinium trenchii]|uniref:Aspartyl/asparaginy/proline hydroxylase domain-containing protein n=1 Tax=Durusdinium trenchii TaxID=1381693 RepID=A0ABP0KY20_9DINO